MSTESCATDVLLNRISELVMCVSLTTLPETLKKKKSNWNGALFPKKIYTKMCLNKLRPEL